MKKRRAKRANQATVHAVINNEVLPDVSYTSARPSVRLSSPFSTSVVRKKTRRNTPALTATRREKSHKTKAFAANSVSGHLNCKRRHKTFNAMKHVLGKGKGAGKRIRRRPNRSRRQFC